MSFATWYDSAWQHPGMAWLGTLPVLAWAALHAARKPASSRADADLRQPFQRRQLALLLILQAVVCVDAWCTGALSPLTVPSPWATASSVFFVIAGDARFFFILQDPSLSSLGAAGRLLRAMLLSTAISAAVYGAVQLFPTQLPTPRHLFLTYELTLLAACVLLLFVFSRRPSSEERRCQLRLARFVCLQYALWVGADLVILSAQAWSDLGYALRFVPNALYYVAFVPFALRFGTYFPAPAPTAAQAFQPKLTAEA